MGIKLVHFATGLPKKMKYETNKEMQTGIQKDAIEESCLSKSGFNGDGVADLKNHGGLDRAVCVYPYEHYSQWEQEFQSPLPSAAFGENITVTNMLERDVYIGDVFQIGGAVIQITQGRIPCSTINKHTHLPNLLKRLVETGFTGYLCRVLEEGTVSRDSKIEHIQSPSKKVSVLEATNTLLHGHHDVERMRTLLEVPELADKMKDKLVKRLEKVTK